MSSTARAPSGRRVEELGLAAALAIECAAFALLSPHFFTAENLLNVSLQASITAIIAAGAVAVVARNAHRLKHAGCNRVRRAALLQHDAPAEVAPL